MLLNADFFVNHIFLGGPGTIRAAYTCQPYMEQMDGVCNTVGRDGNTLYERIGWRKMVFNFAGSARNGLPR